MLHLAYCCISNYRYKEMLKKNKIGQACMILFHSPAIFCSWVFSELDVVSVYLVNINVFSFRILAQSPLDPIELLVTTTSFGDRFH